MQGLEALQAGDSAGLTGLLRLRLDDNQISVLPDGASDPLTRLERLDLRRNQLSALPSGVI